MSTVTFVTVGIVKTVSVTLHSDVGAHQQLCEHAHMVDALEAKQSRAEQAKI